MRVSDGLADALGKVYLKAATNPGDIFVWDPANGGWITQAVAPFSFWQLTSAGLLWEPTPASNAGYVNASPRGPLGPLANLAYSLFRAFRTDYLADPANWESIDLEAHDDGFYYIKSRQLGTGLHRNFRIQIGGADIQEWGTIGAFLDATSIGRPGTAETGNPILFLFGGTGAGASGRSGALQVDTTYTLNFGSPGEHAVYVNCVNQDLPSTGTEVVKYSGDGKISPAMQASGAFNPVSFAAGLTTFDLAVLGADIGDFALASTNAATVNIPLKQAGIIVTAEVSAADVVTVCFYNTTGAPVAFNVAMTVRATVLKGR